MFEDAKQERNAILKAGLGTPSYMCAVGIAGYKTFEQFREAIKPIRGPQGRGWTDADVVLVGAGPIGLTAANVLGSLGVKALLVERNDFSSDLPRALVVDDEYMRLLDNLGILPSLRDDIAAPFGIYFYSSRGRPIIKVRPFLTANGFGTRTGVVQPVFEKILLSNIQRFECVDVQYLTTVPGLRAGADGVRLECARLAAKTEILRRDMSSRATARGASFVLSLVSRLRKRASISIS